MIQTNVLQEKMESVSTRFSSRFTHGATMKSIEMKKGSYQTVLDVVKPKLLIVSTAVVLSLILTEAREPPSMRKSGGIFQILRPNPNRCCHCQIEINKDGFSFDC
jgi:hypothetical protein